MSNDLIVLIIIAVCTFISLIYLTVALAKRSFRLAISGFIMLLCPLVGQVVYFGAYIAGKIRTRMKNVSIEDISFSKERRGRILAPDYEDEIQSVPLEEVLIISQNAEKRKQLLRELKKDEIVNYTMLVKALDNADPETAHYAASAISGAITEFDNNIRALDTMYSHDGGAQDAAFVRKYSDYILKFLKCGILDDLKRRKYSYLFINILTNMENADTFLTSADYSNIIDEYIELKEYGKAREWAQRAFDKNPDENAYLMLAKVYYYTGLSNELAEIIDRLKKSDISLSGEGLDLIRFFMRRAAAK